MPIAMNSHGDRMLINHHVKYKELHGIDEVVKMDKGEHRKLHYRLRKEGKCNITIKKLGKISRNANNRTSETRECKKRYNLANNKKISFYETMGKNVRLYEDLIYNEATGQVYWISRFKADNGFRLKEVAL